MERSLDPLALEGRTWYGVDQAGEVGAFEFGEYPDEVLAHIHELFRIDDVIVG